jgi:hypothetical protein
VRARVVLLASIAVLVALLPLSATAQTGAQAATPVPDPVVMPSQGAGGPALYTVALPLVLKGSPPTTQSPTPTTTLTVQPSPTPTQFGGLRMWGHVYLNELGGPGLAGVTVRWQRFVYPDQNGWTTTDASGHYDLGLIPFPYRPVLLEVTASLEGYSIPPYLDVWYYGGLDVKQLDFVARANTPTPSATPIATYTATPTLTPAPSETLTAIATSTSSATPTATGTELPSPTVTRTPTDTATPSPTGTPTQTATTTATSTPTSTRTPTATDTEPPSPTVTRTPTHTATPSPTGTPTQTATATATSTPTSTRTPTATDTEPPGPTATQTPRPTASETLTPAPTPTATATSTPGPTPTATGSTTPTNTPTATTPGDLMVSGRVLREPRPGVILPLPGATVSVILCVPGSFQDVSASDGSYSIVLPALYLDQCETVSLEVSAEMYCPFSLEIAVADLRAQPVRDLYPTPFPIVPPPPNIQPSCSQFDAPGPDNDNLNEEYVCLENPSCGSIPADFLSGSQLKDAANNTYTFPDFTLPGYGTVKVHTGCGTNTLTDLYWCSASEIWDNDGDTVYLYWTNGNLLDSYTYGGTSTPTPSPSVTPQPTATGTRTPTPTTATATSTPTSTRTPTATPQPVCTPPRCEPGEVLYCPDVCPGGCGYQCGPATPTMTPIPTSTLTPTPTYTGTATRTPGPTPTATTTIYPSPFVKIDPSCSQFDAPGDDGLNLNEEYVCFKNTCCGSAYMGGWQVKDEAANTYTILGLTLAEGATVKLHTGCGANTASDVYWCSASEIWDNDHDTVYLYSAGGGHLLDSYTYSFTRSGQLRAALARQLHCAVR